MPISFVLTEGALSFTLFEYQFVNSVSFNPRDSSQLCSTGTGSHIAFWSFSPKTLRPIEAHISSPDLIDKNDFLTHVWGPFNELFVGTNHGDVLLFPDITKKGERSQKAFFKFY